MSPKRALVLALLVLPLPSVCTMAATPIEAETEGVSAAASPARALSGRFPYGVDLALDRSGHAHIVATNADGDLWYVTDRSGAWLGRRILQGDDGLAWAWPSIATDGRGRVHVAVVRQSISDTPSSTGGIWYVTDKGRPRGDFGPRRRIAGHMMTDPSLRVVDGIRYLAYSRCLCAPGDENAALYFKTDRRGSWTRERVADHGVWPSLRVGADGRARIVFKAPNGLRYTFARTRRGGFSASARIPGSGHGPAQPSLALDGSDRPHVAWVSRGDSDRAWYARRSASGWSSPRDIGPGLKAELSLDERGRPHVVIKGLTWVKHRWLAGGTWRQHFVVDRIDPADVDLSAFGDGAIIAWSQYEIPRGVWVAHD
jgi:hypothetical protein